MPNYRIPEQFIQDLIERSDIVDIVSTRLTLKKRGTNYIGLCPFHQEKTPSFTVSPSKQIYHCFGCSAGGNVLSFVMNHDRLPFQEAIEALARHAGIPIPQFEAHHSKNDTTRTWHDLLKQVSLFYQKTLHESPQGKRALAYLEQRGLSLETIKHFGIGYAGADRQAFLNSFSQNEEMIKGLIVTGMLIKREDSSIFPRFSERIMFPIHDRSGREIAFGGRVLGNHEPKYLNSPETPLFHKSNALYGYHLAKQTLRDKQAVILVEGYMDVVALYQAGFKNCLATLGTALTQEHLNFLFKNHLQIYFCFDGDAAGHKAAARSLEMLLPHMNDDAQVRFVFLPENDDPDSYIKKQGPDAFERTLERSLSFDQYFFMRTTQNIDTTEFTKRAQIAKNARGLIQQMPQGYLQKLMLQALDNLLGLQQTTKPAWNNIYSKGYKGNTRRKKSPDSILPITRTPRPTKLSVMELTIGLLLKHPALGELISDHTFWQTHKSAQLFSEILEIIQRNPNITSEQLIATLAPKQRDITKWVQLIPLFSEQDLKTEFAGALRHLRLETYDHEINQILEAKPMTPEQQQRLQMLILEKKRAQVTGL